jgi:aldose 1-epimerase
VVITDDFYQSSIEIAQTGATLLAFNARINNTVYNVIDCYSSAEALMKGVGARSRIMAPFSNRLQDNRYTYNGVEYCVSDETEIVYHGFVGDKKFEMKNIVISDTYVEITLLLENLSQFCPRGYPFNVDVEVKYILAGNAIRLTITGINNGVNPAPFGTGWHPYFRLADKPIETYMLTIPAEKIVLTDAAFIPYAEKMTFSHLSNLPGSDFRQSVYSKRRILGKRLMNVCYSHLVHGRDGFIISKVENSELNTSLVIKQERGVLYCYTGDDLPDNPRHAIAMEPVEFITNAFNRQEYSEDITLPPGRRRDFVIEVELL